MKFNTSRLNGKITLSTLKALIAAGDELFIRINSRFDGMTDGVEWVKDAAFVPAARKDYTNYDLGVSGVYVVGGSRNSFTRFEENGFIGMRVYNCCGSFVVAIRKTEPVAVPTSVVAAPIQAVQYSETVTAPEAPADAVTVKANTEKNGLEIRFNSRPPQTTLESLKAAGWRWSKFAACWWIKDSPSARGFASLFGSVA